MKRIETIFLIAIFILGIINIYLASQTTMLGEDEAPYVYFGEQLAKGTAEPNLMSPLVPLLYAICGYTLPVAKMITAFFGFLTTVVLFLIGKKLKNVYIGIFSVAVLLLMPLFTQMSMLAYFGVPTAFFSVLFIYIAMDLNSKKKAVLLGLVLGLAYFVKVNTFFLVMIYGLYSLYFLYKRQKKQFKLSLLAIIVSIAVITPYIIRNILIWNYPFFIVLDYLFPLETYATGWINPEGTAASSPIISLTYFTEAWGWIPLVLGIFGLVYIYLDRENNSFGINLTAWVFSLFLFMFITMYALGKIIAETRYLLVIYPQLALIGGFFLAKVKERSKYTLLILIPIVVFAFYSNVTLGLAVSQTTRYPQDYINALNWVDKNTPEDAITFTVYGGSVRNYAHRNNLWVNVNEFDKIMTTDDPAYINTILNKYNISYIIIWRSVVFESYYIPHANLAGVFSFQFVNTVINAPDYFKITYQNENNIVLEIL